MAIIKLQGTAEIEKGIYYEFDTSTAPLGEGGMGKVYRGRCVDAPTGLCKDVAIKFMFDGLAPSVIERARREANIQLKSDNLVEMMGFLTTEEKMPGGKAVRKHYHVVSELLVGVTLSDLLKGVTTTSNGQTIPYAVELYDLYRSNSYEFAAIIVRSLLSGLMALHDAGYIHRDIDPSNIMVTIDRKIKLIDFGIAKHITTLATQDKALTSAGQFIGKAQYAAPELVLGDVFHQDRTTDIYAIGIMFYQLIMGRLPFDGPTTAIISAQLKSKINMADIKNPQARKIIAHATEKDQRKRYSSAAEFRVDIDRFDPNKKDLINLNKTLKWGLPIVVLAFVLLLVFLPKSTTVEPTEQTDSVAVMTDSMLANYPVSIDMKLKLKALYDPATAQLAWKDLNATYSDLQSPIRAEAIFVLSRIYYDYGVTTDSPIGVFDEAVNLRDFYVKVQENLANVMSVNQGTAHKLLEECVKADPKFYPALYELSWDYVWGDKRGTVRDRIQDAPVLEDYLNRTYNAALENNDKLYQDRVAYTRKTVFE